jgi:hypothetical protein
MQFFNNIVDGSLIVANQDKVPQEEEYQQELLKNLTLGEITTIQKECRNAILCITEGRNSSIF